MAFDVSECCFYIPYVVKGDIPVEMVRIAIHLDM